MRKETKNAIAIVLYFLITAIISINGANAQNTNNLMAYVPEVISEFKESTNIVESGNDTISFSLLKGEKYTLIVEGSPSINFKYNNLFLTGKVEKIVIIPSYSMELELIVINNNNKPELYSYILTKN